MDEEDLLENARAYASRQGLEIGERLGSGIHGIIQVVESKAQPGKTALKVHHDTDAYLRERRVYERLRETLVLRISGFHVPQLVRFNDELMAIEMTIVTPPFVLDFAGAYLNSPPAFSDQIWADWEAAKREQFGARWETVLLILAALRRFGIHMLDPSPSNIRFE
jgi:hypothetical protein